MVDVYNVTEVISNRTFMIRSLIEIVIEKVLLATNYRLNTYLFNINPS